MLFVANVLRSPFNIEVSHLVGKIVISGKDEKMLFTGSGCFDCERVNLSTCLNGTYPLQNSENQNLKASF